MNNNIARFIHEINDMDEIWIYNNVEYGLLIIQSEVLTRKANLIQLYAPKAGDKIIIRDKFSFSGPLMLGKFSPLN